MARWDDGYVTDVVYSYASYREMTPAWLATAALMLGHRPPDLTQPFRFADLGCGHGLTATIVAATCPHAEVWGFDFSPAHIESARRLASLAGLSNLHFQEASFAELCAQPPPDAGGFDFVVAHGVMSWISAENRARLVRIVGQWLKPGGLAYLSYNVTTGWAPLLPLRDLMRAVVRTRPERTDRAVAVVLDYLDVLRSAGAGYLNLNPIAAKRLSEMRAQDPRYLAHEFLNADWAPLTFAEVAEAMGGAKSSYIGSATLAENVDAVSLAPDVIRPVMDAADPVLREMVRDFGSAKGFRRDIYRRGVLAVPAPEQVRLLDAVELVWSGRHPETPILLPTPLGDLQGLPEIYTPLMAMLIAGNQTIGAIRQHSAFAGIGATDLLQAVVLLIVGGYAYPALPEAVRARARPGTDRLNAAIGTINADGGDIARLAAATTGAEVPADLLETLVVREKLGGQSMEIEGLTDRILATVAQAGRAVQRDGKPVQDTGEARAIVRATLAGLLGERMTVLARLGVISV